MFDEDFKEKDNDSLGFLLVLGIFLAGVYFFWISIFLMIVGFVLVVVYCCLKELVFWLLGKIREL